MTTISVADRQFVILATDQSTKVVGWCTLVGKEPEDWGEYVPDPPHYNGLRGWIKDMIRSLYADGHRHIVVAVEDVYLAFFKPGKPQVHVYQTLLSTREHIHAAAMDMSVRSDLDFQLSYHVIKPYEALVSLSGVTNTRTKRKERKRIMTAAANAVLRDSVSEHTADALGIGLAAYNRTLSEIAIRAGRPLPRLPVPIP